MNEDPNEASLVLQYKVLKHDLDELLKSISDNSADLDIYEQRSLLRDGIKVISKRCAKVIELTED
jgi:Holliday junction resolvase RusA-like endonuclease